MSPNKFSVALGSAVLLMSAAQAATNNITRSSAFEYDSTGLLIKEVVETSDSTLCVATDYVLDSFGNRKTATTRNCNGSTNEAAAPVAGSDALFTARTVSTTFSSDGRFPITNTNALGQSESKTFDPTLGVLTSLKGPNGLTTAWAYDSFGRKVLEQRADGNGTRWKYEYCSPNNGSTLNCAAVPAAATGSVSVTPAYVVTATPVRLAVVNLTVVSATDNLSTSTDGGDGGANGAYAKTYYDSLGRVIRTETQGYDASGTATLIYQDTAYDSLGRVLGKSRPYYQGAATTYWVTYTYDKLNRVLKEKLPDDSETSTTYQGLVTIVTNAKSQTLKETRNVAGLVTTITDNNGKTLSKTYDAYGNLLTTTDALGNVTTLTYDLKGRKTKMVDPDMGTWTYVYNALGELKSQTDAKSQVTTMAYDLLGRMTQKSEPSLTSNWYYDKYKDNSACAQGIGKLCEVSSGNGYGRKHAYDSLGRPNSTISTIGSAYTASTTYNSNGRVDTVTYPSRDTAGNPLLRVKNVYTELGYLKQVINANAPSKVYWQADSMDAEGHLTQQTTTDSLVTTLYGFDPQTGRLKTIKAGASSNTSYAVQNASYGYDALGNLTSSMDVAAGASMTYAYDGLNRLTGESRLGIAVTTAQTITWAYNEIGNITSRSDVGTYSYPASGATSVRPHAVSGVAGTVNGIAGPSYAYDANGNLISATGRTVTWTSFNKVNTITQTAGSNSNVLGYTYDAEGERVKETYTQNGTLQRTTIYLNPGAGAGLYYEEEITPTATKQKHYLSAAGGTFALLIYNKTAATWTTEYWHKDNLGSTVAVTDQMGAVTERMSYEPFGKRRKTDGATDLLGTLAPTMTRRGFTGHEMIDEVGLVNMNGRIYDPAISRFLSADPIIQAPGYMQSYNRYSYVWNNPTTAADPTGFICIGSCDVISISSKSRNAQVVVRAVAAVADAYGCSGYCSATVGAYYGAQNGGGLKGAVVGGVTGYISYQVSINYPLTGTGGDIIWSNVATASAINAATGCASAAASGGDCGKGAISGAVGTAGAAYGIQGTVIAGCVASSVTGGQCSKGALDALQSAAINYLVQDASRFLADNLRSYLSENLKSNSSPPNISRNKLIFLKPGDDNFNTAINYSEPIPGAFLVVAHGQTDGMTISGPSGPGSSALSVAEFIRTRTEWQQGQMIQIDACWAGSKSNGFAQQLADILKVNVVASPVRTLDFGRMGSIPMASIAIPFTSKAIPYRPESWVMFSPH